MDTSSAAAECVTLQAVAGFVVQLFPTGQGNVIGHPIEPVIMLTANPKTARTMVEHIDLDVSGILRRELTLDQAGDPLIDVISRGECGFGGLERVVEIALTDDERVALHRSAAAVSELVKRLPL